MEFSRTNGIFSKYNRTLIEERKNLRTQELAQAELGTMKLPNNVGKKAKGADFYNEKLEWRKNNSAKDGKYHQL